MFVCLFARVYSTAIANTRKCCFLKFIYLKAELKVFYPLVHSSNGCNDWGWARPKPGARISTVGGRGPSTQAIPCHSPRLVGRELDRSGAAGTQRRLRVCDFKQEAESLAVKVACEQTWTGRSTWPPPPPQACWRGPLPCLSALAPAIARSPAVSPGHQGAARVRGSRPAGLGGGTMGSRLIFLSLPSSSPSDDSILSRSPLSGVQRPE